MKTLIRTIALTIAALMATAAPSNANVMTLDALGDPLSILYHSEDQAYTGVNTFSTFNDLGGVWTWDVLVTQTGTSGQIDITGNIQIPNASGFRRGFEFTLDGPLDFASAVIIDGADFTGFVAPFVTVTADTLSFIADNFGAPNQNLHAVIAFTTNTTVPGPAAVLLLGIGLVGYGIARRRPA
jgi:phospholipase/lecithinase/hemolysin